MNHALIALLCIASGIGVAADAAELSGKIGGADWRAVAVVKSPVQLSETSISYSICAEALDPKQPFGAKPQVMIEIPKHPKVGDALMGHGKIITFFAPPGNNEAFDDGTEVVSAVTAATVTVTFDATMDKDDWIKGQVAIPLGE